LQVPWAQVVGPVQPLPPHCPYRGAPVPLDAVVVVRAEVVVVRLEVVVVRAVVVCWPGVVVRVVVASVVVRAVVVG